MSVRAKIILKWLLFSLAIWAGIERLLFLFWPLLMAMFWLANSFEQQKPDNRGDLILLFTLASFLVIMWIGFSITTDFFKYGIGRIVFWTYCGIAVIAGLVHDFKLLKGPRPDSRL